MSLRGIFWEAEERRLGAAWRGFLITGAWTALVLVSAGLLLVACGGSRIEIGMVETNLGGEWQASYQTFTGRKVDTFRAESEQILRLDYDIQVDKGSLEIQVRSPADDAIWAETFLQDRSDSMEIPLERSGRYSIVVVGEGTGGGWEINLDAQ